MIRACRLPDGQIRTPCRPKEVVCQVHFAVWAKNCGLFAVMGCFLKFQIPKKRESFLLVRVDMS
jgi:hypothetical protein